MRKHQQEDDGEESPTTPSKYSKNHFSQHMKAVSGTTTTTHKNNNNSNNHNFVTTNFSNLSLSSPLVQLAIVVVACLCLLLLVFFTLPSFKNKDDLSKLRIPKSIGQVRDLAHLLSQYTEHSYYRVLCAIFCLYIFLQTFSVPGTIFLNVLCGALFGLKVAFVMTLLAGTAGASCAFMLSHIFGRTILLTYFSDRLSFFRSQIDKHKGNLFYFMLFLRISPMLPNWFINVCSPILQVPFMYFFGATLIGIAPQTAISVNIGANIYNFVDDEKAGNPFINLGNILTLFGIAVLALLPVFLKKRSS